MGVSRAELQDLPKPEPLMEEQDEDPDENSVSAEGAIPDHQ